MSSSLSYLLIFTSCNTFESTVALCLAECITLSLPKAQKTLLFRSSQRPSIYYWIWMLENGKHLQEINFLQLTQYSNSIAMDGGEIKKGKKSPASATAILLCLCVAALTERFIEKVHFTNWHFSHGDQFFLLSSV